MTSWYVGIEGAPLDIEQLSVRFPNAEFKVKTVDGMPHLESSNFENQTEARHVRDIAEELLNSLNLALASTDPDFTPLRTANVVADIDGKKHRTMFAEAGHYPFRIRMSVTGTTVRQADGTISSSSPPGPTLPEMIARLVRDDVNIAAAALALTTRPTTWGNLFIVYETAARLISTSPYDPKASDYAQLWDNGWISEMDADRFRNWAHFNRHGYPRELPRVKEMELAEATQLIQRLFHFLIEHIHSD